MLYQVKIPATADCEPDTLRARNRADALWQHNALRRANGLPGRKRLPAGTTYTKLKA